MGHGELARWADLVLVTLYCQHNGIANLGKLQIY